MELELQLIDASTFDLTSKAKTLMHCVEASQYHHAVKPEITQSMIEINTQIQNYPGEFYKELKEIVYFLTQEAMKEKTYIAGAGTHPFQFWLARKIFPSQRFKQKSEEHGYLSKRFTIFAMHVHIGCQNSEDALYLTHSLTRYIPQIIALSASSPFYQKSITGFQSTRTTIVSSHPFSGTMPYMTTWEAFSAYFNKMRDLHIIESMKDFYWDIRPKPEFGTVEIRVCDMPLTFDKAISIAAYIQSLARYLLMEKPFNISEQLYLVYEYNRLQASHNGFNAKFIDPNNLEAFSVIEDIKKTLPLIHHHAQDLQNQEDLEKIKEWVIKEENDAKILLEIYHQHQDFKEVVEQQCKIWLNSVYR